MEQELITPTEATPEIDADARELMSARRTNPEQMETARWSEGRTQDIDANRALKQTLGLEYEAYSKQLEELSSEERLDLKDKSAEEIAELLDTRAEADRDLKKLEKQAKEQAEANFDAIETPHQREVRLAMKSAYKEVASLDDRIAELHKLNEMRKNPMHEGWDDQSMDADTWRLVREGKVEGFEGDIANLIQEKQAKLQEAALHQNAYHEVARAHAVPDRPIGQIGPMQVTQSDIATLVQLERDQQAHQQRTIEAKQHYSDFEHVVKNAIASGLDVGNREAAFIQTLPNSADVVYYLCSHPDEIRALARMPSHESSRALINISHKAARPSVKEGKRNTSAPKPPSPVSGSSRGDWHVNDESGSADEWFHRRNADLQRRGKF